MEYVGLSENEYPKPAILIRKIWAHDETNGF
jgi:hypothetical protein